MATVRVLVLRAAGTNCDLESVHAWQLAGAQAERIHVRRLLELPALLNAFQILTIPGGFSYGDDVAAGRILAAQLKRHLLEPMRAFLGRGKLILGICNGFQVLVQTELLPFSGAPGRASGWGNPDAREDSGTAGAGHGGAAVPPALPAAGRRHCTITYNDPPGFQDRWVCVRATSERCVFLEAGRQYEMPIAHGEGRVLFDDDAVYGRVVKAGQNALVYCPLPSTAAPACHGEEAGSLGQQPANPNGSQGDIAGLCDETGRVLGLMPHPDRFVTWTQHPCWTSAPARPEGDGLALFRRGVQYFE